MIAEVPVEELLLWLGGGPPLPLPLPPWPVADASTSMDSSLSSPLCSERSLQSTSSALFPVSFICSSGFSGVGLGAKVSGGEAGLSLTMRTN